MLGIHLAKKRKWKTLGVLLGMCLILILAGAALSMIK